MKAAFFVTVLLLSVSLSLAGQEAVPYPNELPGYRFYETAKWRNLRPSSPTIVDVRKLLGNPDIATDLAHPVAPYPGDANVTGVSSRPSPELFSVDTGSPIREIKGWQEQDRVIQVTADGKVVFVVNYNGLSAAIYRLHLDNGSRQLVKTLEMHDPAGGFGITRVLTTPDGQYFAYNTLRQLSELYLLQGLY
jgi:hypothetical protein